MAREQSWAVLFLALPFTQHFPHVWLSRLLGLFSPNILQRSCGGTSVSDWNVSF